MTTDPGHTPPPPHRESLKRQLAHVIALAYRYGLYDAADAIFEQWFPEETDDRPDGLRMCKDELAGARREIEAKDRRIEELEAQNEHLEGLLSDLGPAFSRVPRED